MNRIAIVAACALLIGACDRPWARVPDAPIAIAACTAPPTPMTACEWASGFDDLLVFAIDGRRALTEPVLDQSGNTVADTSSCRLVSEGVEIYGYTETSAFGTTTSSFLFPGDHELQREGDLANGSRVLVAVAEATNFTAPQFVRRRFWPIVSEEGIVTLQNTECTLGSEIDGLPVDEVLKLVASCPRPGEFVDRPVVVGAVCFPPDLE